MAKTKQFTVIKLNTANRLDELYNDSALTLEGLSEDSFGDFIDWVKDQGCKFKKKPEIYSVSGKIMNEYCEIRHDKYNDDLTIACIKLSDLDTSEPLIFARMEIHARWFDDVVDNNRGR